MRHKILLCVIVISVFLSANSSAQDLLQIKNIPSSCALIVEHEYEMLDYTTPESTATDPQAPQIIEEYGVFYNIIQMPVDYDIPTEIKVFAVDNGIDGVVIVLNYEDDLEVIIAEITRTIDQKIVLIVSDNITRKPEMIARILMGITKTHEAQSRELRSAIRVDQDDKGWKAKFAKTVKKGIEKVTNVDMEEKINLNKMSIEESGYFDEMFGVDKMTLFIRGYGPYEIEIKEIENVISTVSNITAHLVFKILFIDENVPYADDLYIGDDGRMYSCPI